MKVIRQIKNKPQQPKAKAPTRRKGKAPVRPEVRLTDDVPTAVGMTDNEESS